MSASILTGQTMAGVGWAVGRGSGPRVTGDDDAPQIGGDHVIVKPVQFQARRIPRPEVPSGDEFTRWLDDQWVQADLAVHRLLHPEGTA